MKITGCFAILLAATIWCVSNTAAAQRPTTTPTDIVQRSSCRPVGGTRTYHCEGFHNVQFHALGDPSLDAFIDVRIVEIDPVTRMAHVEGPGQAVSWPAYNITLTLNAIDAAGAAHPLATLAPEIGMGCDTRGDGHGRWFRLDGPLNWYNFTTYAQAFQVEATAFAMPRSC